MRLQDNKIRKCDVHGCGHFGASRGDRLHRGVDVECVAGEVIASSTSGTVTKLGIVYADEALRHFRYVEVTKGDYRYRYFYVDPLVKVGQNVGVDSLLGIAQDLSLYYEGITQHCHFEIKDKDGTYVDPTPLLLALKEPEYGHV